MFDVVTVLHLLEDHLEWIQYIYFFAFNAILFSYYPFKALKILYKTDHRRFLVTITSDQETCWSLFHLYDETQTGRRFSRFFAFQILYILIS